MFQNMLDLGILGELKRCNGCRWLSVDRFDKNPKTNVWYSKCLDCRLKHNASSHSKRDADLKKQKAALAAGETPETLICNSCGPLPFVAFGTNADTGKPLRHCKPCNVKMLERIAAYKQTDAGKAASKRSNKSEAGKESKKRYKQTDVGPLETPVSDSDSD